MKRPIFGCGYLGPRAARAWQHAGDQVFAVAGNKSRASEFQDEGWRTIVADVTKPATLRPYRSSTRCSLLAKIGPCIQTSGWFM